MFSVVTDTSANLDCELAKERNIHIVPFHYYVNGEDMTCTDTRSFDGKTFYDAMRAGAKVTTSQITPQSYIDTLTPLLEKGEDILFVGMSSGVSGSTNPSCARAASTSGSMLSRIFPEYPSI